MMTSHQQRHEVAVDMWRLAVVLTVPTALLFLLDLRAFFIVMGFWTFLRLTPITVSAIARRRP